MRRTYDNSTYIDSQDGIIAFAGGGQANATELTAMNNYVATVASAGDSTKCEGAQMSLQKNVYNISANDMDLFPAVGEYFRNGSTLMTINTQISIGSGNSIRLICYEKGVWTFN